MVSCSEQGWQAIMATLKNTLKNRPDKYNMRLNAKESNIIRITLIWQRMSPAKAGNNNAISEAYWLIL